LETCNSTKDRIDAFSEAKKMSEVNSFDLRKLGYSIGLSEGIVYALNNYEHTNIDKYVALINESLEFLKPGKDTLPDLKSELDLEKHIEVDTEKPRNDQVLSTNGKDDNIEEIEQTIFDIIKEIEGDDGASWDSITEKCKKAGIDKESIEESINSLMDKGLIFEPILGIIKVT
jgi:hypothetical protein